MLEEDPLAVDNSAELQTPNLIPDEPQDPVKQPALPQTSPEQAAQDVPKTGMQDPPPPTSVREVLALRARQQQRIAMENFTLATQQDPALAAEAQRIGKEIGVDPATAASNIDVARTIAQRKQMEDQSFFAANPVLAQSMQDIEFAKAAQKDLEKLSFVERTAGGFFGAMEAGAFEVELGRLGNKLLFGGGADVNQLGKPMEEITDYDYKRIAFIQSELARLPKAQGILGSAGHMAGQMAVTLPEAVTTGLAAGNAAAAASIGASLLLGPEVLPAAPVMFAGGFSSGMAASIFASSAAIETGTQYLQMLDAGYGERSARWAALGVGLFTGATEVLGDAVISRSIRGLVREKVGAEVSKAMFQPGWRIAGAKFAKNWIENIVAESTVETSQTAAEMIAEEIARVVDSQEPSGKPRLDKQGNPISSAISRGEFTQQLLDTAVSTAQGMVLLGAFDPGIQLYRDAKQVVAARANYKQLNRLIDGAVESELRKSNPAAAEKFFGDAVRGKIENFYIDKQTLAGVLHQLDAEETGGPQKSNAEQLAAKMPEVFAAAAEKEGGDVVIPTEKYLTEIANSPKLDKALRPHLRIDASAISQAEAESIDMKARVAEFQKSAADQEKFDTAAQAVEDNARKAIDYAAQKAGSNLTKNQIDAAALLIRSFYEQRARREGRLPSDIAPLNFTEKEPVAGTAAQPGKGAFDPSKLLIHLNDQSDASTLIHEMSHGFFHLMLNTPSPDVATITDVQTLMDWFKVKDTAAWEKLGVTGQEQHQEALARAFEHYIAEGTAPSAELQTVFEKMARWMRTVYAGVLQKINAAYKQQFNTDLPALTPEVRRVFGAMLASQEAIDQTMAVRGQAAFFDGRQNFPGTDEQWAEYQALEQARREGGISKLTAEMQKNISWLAGRQKQLQTEVSNQARAAREAAGKTAHTEVSQEPVYALRSWLKEARQNEEQTHRLNSDQVKEVLGADAEKLAGATSQKGWDIDLLANKFGFESGEQMVRTLAEAPTLADAVTQRTDEIMLRDHSTLRDDAAQAAAIDEALNTEAASKLLASLLRMFEKLSNPDRLTLAAAKEQARLRLLNTPVGQIKSRSYLLAAARAEKAAIAEFNGKRASTSKTGEERPAKAPNPQKAIEHLRTALLNAEMAKQAAKIEKEVTKTASRLVDKFFTDDATVKKTHNLDWVNTGRAILGGYGLGPQSKLPLEHFESLREYDPVLHGLLDDHVKRVTQGNTVQDYRHLTLDAFRNLTEELNSLWERSAREQQILVNDKLERKETAKAAILAKLQERVGSASVSPLTSTGGSKFNSAKAVISKVEHVLRWLDGGAFGGPLTRYLWTTLRSKFAEYEIDRHHFLNRFNTLFSNLYDGGLLSPLQFTSQALGKTFSGTAEILGALIHMGNASNMENLLKGYGWTQAQWNAFLVELQQGNRIKKEHIDALQAVGNLFEELKVRAQKVNHEANGTFFTEVEIKPITTPWGTYQGWYAPSTVDSMHPLNTDIATQENAENPNLTAARNMTNNSAAPKVPTKWMETRTGGARPRLMDITRLPAALDQQLRFIHLQIPMRDVWSLVSDGQIGSMLEAAAPGFVRGVLKPMLDDTANGKMSKQGLGNGVFDKMWNFFKRNTSRMFMAGSIINGLQQYTGIQQLTTYLPFETVMEANSRVIGMGAEESDAYVLGKSTAMQARHQEHSGSQMQDLNLWLNPTGWAKVNRFADKAAFYLINTAQWHTDKVAWIAGYNEQIAKNPENEAAAIQAGDAMVRITQGNRTTMDTAAIERSTPAVQLVTQFNSYWINLFNTIAFNDNKSRAIVWSFLVPTFTGAAVALALSGGKAVRDKDKNDAVTLDATLRWILTQPVRGGGSAFPVLGPMASWVFTSQGRPGDIPAIAPAMRGVSATRDTINDLVANLKYGAGITSEVNRAAGRQGGELRGQELRDIGLTIAFWTGIPVNVVLDRLAYLEDYHDKTTKTNPFLGLLGTAR